MVDGPRLVAAIRSKAYVIQPPGYWLFAHLAALFHDPAAGLSFWNHFFSASGVAVLFLLCRRLGSSRVVSTLAALAYGSIFFVWFAGDTHSSYPTQILFPPLFIYVGLLYRAKPSVTRLITWAAVFSIGSGLRPSDGAFLIPLYCWFLFCWIGTARHRMQFLAATVVLCLAWYLPTHAALAATGAFAFNKDLHEAMRQRSLIMGGLSLGAALNVIRVIVPLVAAFWMLPLTFRHTAGRELRLLCALWAVPGIAFLALIYMADADYLCFCAGAFIVYAASAGSERISRVALVLCLAWNSALFLLARPIHSTALVPSLANFYVIKYCHYGIMHQWTTTLGGGGSIPQ